MATATLPATNAPAQVVSEAVHAALESTFAAICGEKPRRCEGDVTPTSCVAGIISFTGDVTWSLSWVLAHDSAPALVQKFTGFEIPFDSPDMGDAVAELVNVLAGDVVVQMEKRRLKAKMAIPMVARGCPLELMSARNATATRVEYTSSYGRFGLAIVVR